MKPVLLTLVLAVPVLALPVLSVPARAAAPAELAATGADAIDFARDIQPILSAKCFDCHGSDTKSKADLRLDARAFALKGGESGPALVPGRSADSRLYQRILSDDPDTVMPPKGERLSAAEQEIVRRWIDTGAHWPESAPVDDKTRHWAFLAPVRPPVPALPASTLPEDEAATAGGATGSPAAAAQAAGAGEAATATATPAPPHPIDAFVAQRLARESLRFSPPADRATLLRRLHFDLTGLPPTQAETAAFVADSAPDAVARKIDALLASPHFGERWARHWLDAARYADSQGYEKDPPRYSVWFWRDWVINAHNRDLPYDRFLIEQLAGDLLPEATQDQIVATGFLRQSMVNEEGGVDPEQFRMEAMFDRMDALGKSVLGLTIQCAQCHNHKFDPISHEEYYRMFAFLNNGDEPQRVVYAPADLRLIGTLRSQMAEIEAGVREVHASWAADQAAWEQRLQEAPSPTWETLTGTWNLDSLGGSKYLPRPDGSYLAQSYAPTKHSAELPAQTTLKQITAFRLELLTDPNLPCGGPGRSFKGTGALTEFRARVGGEDVTFVRAEADFGEAPGSPLEPNFDDRSGKTRVTGPASYAIDGDDLTAWGIDAGPGRRNQPRVIHFYPERPVAVPADGTLSIWLVQNHGGWNSDDLMNNNLGRFRLSVTGDAEVPPPAVPPRVAEALAIAPAHRSPAQQETVFAAWRAGRPESAEATARIEALWSQWPAGATALTLMERAEPRPTMVLKRGDWLQPGRAVTPGVPAVLHPLPPDAGTDRLAFARWLVSRDAPTTARTKVNRVWQHLFGTGFVASSEDLGVQSEPPSHPELLDWLAVEFMDRGWSLKHLLRLIMTSRTYQQQSAVTPDSYTRDPGNRLLARGPRLRVDAEIVRDIALATSGLLNPAIGGPSVMTPAPAHLFAPPASYAPFPWVNATGPDTYRRALYTFRRRSTPYPALQSFDAPVGDTSCVRRARSNTPMQALTALNEDLFVEAARALGRRVLTEGGGTTESRIRWAFREVLSREPQPAELTDLIVLAARQTKRFADGTADPAEAATGQKSTAPDLPAGTTARDLAIATVIARVLLNTDEAITKE